MSVHPPVIISLFEIEDDYDVDQDDVRDTGAIVLPLFSTKEKL